jgi:hypothetical protein
MIVSCDHKFVYMNIGKTGSITIGTLLEKEYNAFVWKKWDKTALQPKCAPQHICHLPKQFSEYLIITSVRNPFTHELSRYTHGNPNHKKHPITMDGFRQWLKRKWMETYFSKLNMSENYNPPKGCVKYKVNHIIRLESIEKDFNSLPFVSEPIKVPHYNKTQNPQDKLFYTEEMADLVREKRRVDFELFGYSEELPIEMQRIKCL